MRILGGKVSGVAAVLAGRAMAFLQVPAPSLSSYTRGQMGKSGSSFRKQVAKRDWNLAVWSQSVLSREPPWWVVLVGCGLREVLRAHNNLEAACANALYNKCKIIVHVEKIR